MNAMTSVFPFTLHWDSQDLADAVPLRLFELCDFTANEGEAASANTVALHKRPCGGRSYLPTPALTAHFRVHG